MFTKPTQRLALATAASVTFLTGCTVGPDYVQPTVPQPTAYQEKAPWKKANPRDDISKGDWYKVFHDTKLNELEGEAVNDSLTLRAAIARVSESRASAREAEAAFYPSIDFSGNATRERTSPNNGALLAQTGGVGIAHTYNSVTVVPFDLSYEVDLWGRVRRTFEAAGDTAQASVADYENVLLTLKADVATEYFAVRTADSQIDVQNRTIKEFQDNLDLTNSRFQGGISTQLDVEQAKATLAAAQAQLATFKQSRAQLEHALAVLLGRPPEGFTLPYHPLDTHVPSIPAGLPSELLERRPDVAEAERKVAAQNAEIGGAIAAYFPGLHLTGATGLSRGER